jgi:hypothetical protein
VRGPGRLRIARAISDPRRTGHGLEKAPKTEAGKRVIALDQETVQALLADRELVGGGAYDRIFTSPGGSRGPAGTPVHRNDRLIEPALDATMWFPAYVPQVASSTPNNCLQDAPHTDWSACTSWHAGSPPSLSRGGRSAGAGAARG